MTPPRGAELMVLVDTSVWVEVARPGALPYQTQINQTLRKAVIREELRPEQTEAIKAVLLEDPDFLRAVAHRIAARGKAG